MAKIGALRERIGASGDLQLPVGRPAPYTARPMTTPPPDTTDELSDGRIAELLTQFQPQNVPPGRRIFANRNLRMSSIKMIGYDMDYTLAEYHVTVEELAVRLTVEKLINEYGYPAEVAELPYDPNFAIRGLIVDKRTGNLLKMDSHKHISRVFHGTKTLEKQERRRLYRNESIRISGARYALIDTLFAVPEAWLYAVLVDTLDERASKAPAKRRRKRKDGSISTAVGRRYQKLYDDIRAAIDMVHADQSLKNIIIADMARYVRKDPDLAGSLHDLRHAGKQLFLMTNSYGPYSTKVMEYLLDGERPDYPSWKDYFDIIVVGAKKPSFFEKGCEFQQLDADHRHMGHPVTSFKHRETYEGGNLADFERMAGVAGDEILYIGDNLYGDILRSKKTSTWRTVMIVPELERELKLSRDQAPSFERRSQLETHRRQIDLELHQEQQLLSSLSEFVKDRQGQFSADERKAFEHAMSVSTDKKGDLESALHKCLGAIWHLNRRIERSFNPYWGMLFKSRAEHSIFGEQIEDYACVYTSRASNFAAYSPFQYFRTPRDFLPHEHAVVEQSKAHNLLEQDR
ncbi:MAG: 5'-nucleotidase [Myxococcota bacterium]|jgi:5'-nucleotidase